MSGLEQEYGPSAPPHFMVSVQPVPQRYRQLIWSMDDASMPLVLSYPYPMGSDEVAEVQQVLLLWLGQMERAATPPRSRNAERGR